MFNKSDLLRNQNQLFGAQAKCGYDWWWHSFTARDAQTGEEKPFFVEFFLCNPALGKEEPVFGQLEENKKNGVKPSYLMVKAGTWGSNAVQLHRFFGWKKVDAPFSKTYHVSAGDCYIDDFRTTGKISITKEESENHPEWMCGWGEIEWNLKIEKKVAFNVGYGAGKLFRKLQLFEMFWHAEGMKSLFEGEIIFNGKKYIVSKENSYGYSDKNWGKDFTSPWLWLSSNNLTSKISGKKLENSVFDIGGGRPKCGPIVLNRKLLGAFWYEGKGYEFNFSKFWTMTRTKFSCKETESQIIWHVEQKNFSSKMITDVTCEKNEMLFVNYEAPNGKKLHNRLFNGGNGKGTVKLYHCGKLLDEIECKNVGCEYGTFDGEEW